MEKLILHPKGEIQKLIDAGADQNQIKAEIELWGHDAGVYLPENNNSGMIDGKEASHGQDQA